ncbi:MAG TPA: MarR family transcriptional regulator [Candidatus Limnocylindria bacterium]|nr:MarR family transcriptional regulator [Candidatus Limnocylindria bacterium]
MPKLPLDRAGGGAATEQADRTEPNWLSDREQAGWRAFLGATHLLMDRLDRELQRDAGMPHAYYAILAMLSEAPERALRMSELADLTLSSRSRVSHAIARLEESGWVRREVCPSDRRGAIAVLTDAGFTALEKAAPRHVVGVREHFVDPLSPEQLDRLRDACEALFRHLAGPDNPFARLTDPTR